VGVSKRAEVTIVGVKYNSVRVNTTNKCGIW